MLEVEKTLLLIVDIQGKLANSMHEKEQLFAHVQKLIKGIRVLGIPILWAEQYPKGLGPTVPEVAGLLPDLQPISKMSFSCCRDDSFMQALQAARRKQILIAGIEAHVCVYQTALDLIELRYEVQIVTDAVSSRTPENKKIGLERMSDCGASLTSVETALFELLTVAGSEQFKEISRIVK